MAYTNTIRVTFSGVGRGLDGTWTLTFNSGLGYWVFTDTHSITGGTATLEMHVLVSSGQTTLHGTYTEIDDVPEYEVSFTDTVASEYAASFVNHDEGQTGTATVTNVSASSGNQGGGYEYNWNF
jgi:hypothetical protein